MNTRWNFKVTRHNSYMVWNFKGNHEIYDTMYEKFGLIISQDF